MFSRNLAVSHDAQMRNEFSTYYLKSTQESTRKKFLGIQFSVKFCKQVWDSSWDFFCVWCVRLCVRVCWTYMVYCGVCVCICKYGCVTSCIEIKGRWQVSYNFMQFFIYLQMSLIESWAVMIGRKPWHNPCLHPSPRVTMPAFIISTFLCFMVLFLFALVVPAPASSSLMPSCLFFLFLNAAHPWYPNSSLMETLGNVSSAILFLMPNL